MDSLATVSNEGNEFKIKISANAPNNHVINLLLKYSDGNDYSDFQWTEIKIHRTHMMFPNHFTFRLNQNYPNPFNPTTKISYSLAWECMVTLKVYDILGREIITLVNGIKKRGSYQVEFNGNNLASGIYFYILKAGSYFETRKFILLK